jgi:hypothetical protein
LERLAVLHLLDGQRVSERAFRTAEKRIALPDYKPRRDRDNGEDRGRNSEFHSPTARAFIVFTNWNVRCLIQGVDARRFVPPGNGL